MMYNTLFRLTLFIYAKLLSAILDCVCVFGTSHGTLCSVVILLPAYKCNSIFQMNESPAIYPFG